MMPILEVEGISKEFEGFSLHDVSFSLPRGYIMGLIGPNGAGKTTLLKSILNLVEPDAGEIRIFGLDWSKEGESIRSRIGFVHESPTFYEALSVEKMADVIGPFYPTWNSSDFRRLAAEFELPPGKKIKSLSQGQRTRFALAVALAHRAELLILDEPSSGLDPAFRREILDRLAGVIEDGYSSVLFSTHITSDLDRLADFITYIQDGRIQLSMTKDECLERHALVRGEVGLLTREIEDMFMGIVVGDLGFVGLTNDVGSVHATLDGESIVVDRATLEDIVFYTGRTGKGGLDLHGIPA